MKNDSLGIEHVAMYKIIFPTNALFIKTYNATICI
jgi:hypothetical protein